MRLQYILVGLKYFIKCVDKEKLSKYKKKLKMPCKNLGLLMNFSLFYFQQNEGEDE